MIGKLTRYESTSSGTFGVMTFDGLTLQTVERPWLNNKSFESCIPAGEYKLEPFTRPNGDNVYALVGGSVSLHKEDGFKRYLVLIHAGNYMTDVVGCIAPGLTRHESMVTSSRNAMGKLMAHLAGGEHSLIIEFGEHNG